MISIIIPHYNRSHLLVETLKSVVNQTYKEWEVIIVDDGSKDNPETLIEDYLVNYPIQFIKKKNKPKGPSASRNLGAQIAKGIYLLFLDSDDIIAKTCLENRVKYLEDKPDLNFAVFTQGQFSKVPGDIEEIFTKFFSKKDEYLKAFLRDEHPWQTSGPLWKKESFLLLGGFNERYTCMEDPELHIRALLEGLNFDVVESYPDFYYRIANSNQLNNKKFWDNSIIGRSFFYKDMLFLIKQKQLNSYLLLNLKLGFTRYLKFFMVARLDAYKCLYDNMLTWGYKNQLISGFNFILFLLIKMRIIKMLRLRGLIYSLIKI